MMARFLSLIKARQTFLLVITGVAGYFSAHVSTLDGWKFVGLVSSLFLAVSGSTMVNMWFDRDIDALMKRTSHRPLSSGWAKPGVVLIFGVILSGLGLWWSLKLSTVYAVLTGIGLGIEIVVYTIWLKRRTCWSIICGGLSGGIPILAGRALNIAKIDLIGILLAMTIIFWIPIHNLTLSIFHFSDYRVAEIPVFPTVYGLRMTRLTILICSLLTGLLMVAVFVILGITWSIVLILGLLNLWLLYRTSVLIHTESAMNLLYKSASIYMLVCMLLLIIGGLLHPYPNL